MYTSFVVPPSSWCPGDLKTSSQVSPLTLDAADRALADVAREDPEAAAVLGRLAEDAGTDRGAVARLDLLALEPVAGGCHRVLLRGCSAAVLQSEPKKGWIRASKGADLRRSRPRSGRSGTM